MFACTHKLLPTPPQLCIGHPHEFELPLRPRRHITRGTITAQPTLANPSKANATTATGCMPTNRALHVKPHIHLPHRVNAAVLLKKKWGHAVDPLKPANRSPIRLGRRRCTSRPACHWCKATVVFAAQWQCLNKTRAGTEWAEVLQEHTHVALCFAQASDCLHTQCAHATHPP